MSSSNRQPYFDPWDPSFQLDPYARFKPLYDLAPQEMEWERMPRSMAVAVPRGRPGLIAARYDDVTTVLRDERRFSSIRPRLPEGASVKRIPLGVYAVTTMVFLDPPEHSRLRRLLNRAFSLRQIREFEPHVEALVNQVVDSVSNVSAASGRFDLVSEFANPIPSMVIAYLLGVPTQDYAAFKSWSDTTVSADYIPPGKPYPKEIPEAAAALRSYLESQVEKKRRNPGDDIISLLVAAQEERDALTAPELEAFAMLLLSAGNETTANLLGNGLLALCRHPDQFEMLRGSPAMVPNAVEEMLRYDPPQQGTVRWAKYDTELGGTPVAAGQPIVVLLGAANHDPAKFPNPDVFDMTRDPNDHLALGEGIHFCLGAGLARCEATKAVGALLGRFPKLRLANPDQPVEHKPNYFIRGLKSLMMATD
jgi:pimeloyl-[acyl-carrier protein] synthase